MSAPAPVAVLGVGMHPWGKWGRPFHEYGVDAALAALDDAGVDTSACMEQEPLLDATAVGHPVACHFPSLAGDLTFGGDAVSAVVHG